MNKIFFLLVGVLLLSGICLADTLRFNETFGTIGSSGLTVNGATFTLAGGSDDATYGYDLVDPLFSDLQGAVLFGPADGTLTIDFGPTGTPSLLFAVGLGADVQSPDGFTVQLLRLGVPVYSTGWPVSTVILLPEGRFTYFGDAIDKAVITFAPDGNFFALDNLTFNGGASIPEPGVFGLIGSGLVLAGLIRRACPMAKR